MNINELGISYIAYLQVRECKLFDMHAVAARTGFTC